MCITKLETQNTGDMSMKRSVQGSLDEEIQSYINWF
jgi:hypothetical protein